MIAVSNHFTESSHQKIKSFLRGYEVFKINETENLKIKALIIRSKDQITTDILIQYPNLEIVVSATSGFDHMDFRSLKGRMTLCYSPNANVDSASELTLYHMLGALKKGKKLMTETPLSRDDSILGSELSSKTIGLIGYGRIGKKVSKILSAFGCKVLAFDPYIHESNFKYAESVSFNYALKYSDIVSLHCPLTSKTEKMIDVKALSLMNESSVLINCARGRLIDEAALIKALDKRKLGFASLDVFEKEPLDPDSPILKSPYILTSPHIGGFTNEAHEKSALEAARQVKNWFELSSPVLSLVPPDVVWSKDL